MTNGCQRLDRNVDFLIAYPGKEIDSARGRCVENLTSNYRQREKERERERERTLGSEKEKPGKQSHLKAEVRDPLTAGRGPRRFYCSNNAIVTVHKDISICIVI